MLKKTAPSWGPKQTKAVQTLKSLCKEPIPLHIPSTGHRILQTDASDEFWGAILLEKLNNIVHYYCHASGQFSDSEKHYHISIKETLAVKYAIKKFEFHLIDHQFTIQMDNYSFPKILNFKSKMIPEPQLLRLKDWFSKYQFTVEHVKGKTNILADFLSRPKSIPSLLISSVNSFIPFFMIRFSCPQEIQHFPSLANLYLFAHENLEKYKVLFTSDYQEVKTKDSVIIRKFKSSISLFYS
jgi:hypothetical protein